MKIFGIEKKGEYTKKYFLGPLSIKIEKSKDEYIKNILFGLIKIENKRIYKIITILYLFKLKKANYEYINRSLKKIENSLNSQQVLLLNNVNVSEMKKATGILRILQLTQIKLFHIVDDICRKNGLSYFMLFGTLLGAVRHKGFIPWDDDLDVMMLRDDYNKFVEIFKNKYNCDKLAYYYWSNTEFSTLRIILKMPDTPPHLIHCPFIDIHVFDAYHKIADEKDKAYIQNKVIKTYKNINFIKIDDLENQQDDIKENLKKLYEYTKKVILRGNKVQDYKNTSYFLSCETPANPTPIFEYDEIFPLVEMEFEDGKFFAPKCWEKYLYNQYGDYMLPHIDGFYYHYGSYKFSYEQIEFIKKFLS